MPRNLTFLVQVRLNADTPVSSAQVDAFIGELEESARAWLNFFTDSTTSPQVAVHPFWTPEQAAAIVESFLQQSDRALPADLHHDHGTLHA